MPHLARRALSTTIWRRRRRSAPGNGAWCEIEQRPAPAPVDAQDEDVTTIYIAHKEVGIRYAGGVHMGP